MILDDSNFSEGYVIDPKGKLISKVSLPLLLKTRNKKNFLNDKSFRKYLYLYTADTVLEAIDKVKDFVGETVPVIDKKGFIKGTISESDLFNSLLLAEKERNEEELS